MTAILRSGDKIHIAFGVDTGTTKVRAEEVAQDYLNMYSRLGVTIVQWTASTALTAPVIVAIFRDTD